ncbi:MAG: sulfate ABC transporter substrate-binding protein [Pseudanabaenaceae cyanobacterium bins.39]|nr:sulfate ABC transporter substrate-binding protein [Pseudanabaenaceae cyanobacterium bins.39]
MIAFGAGVLISLTMGACSTISLNGNSQSDVEITLVSFAVTKQAYKQIIPKFVAKWQAEHNQRVTIAQSYGGSGSQTRAVIDGLDADIVHLALAADTAKIAKAGLIDQGWEQELPNNAIVSRSVPVIVTRPNNPKNIQTYADLEKDGIKLVTADPKTSGVARWNFLALWNAAAQRFNNEQNILSAIAKVYRNVPILTRDAREATDAFFKQGQGDALINYENEIILAQQKGLKASYIIPDINISIDNAIAIVDRNVTKHRNQEVATAFAQFLFTPEAQIEFAKVGFRPVNPSIAQAEEFRKLYPPIKQLATVQDLGGWDQVNQKFFADGAAFDQIQKQINL